MSRAMDEPMTTGERDVTAFYPSGAEVYARGRDLTLLGLGAKGEDEAYPALILTRETTVPGAGTLQAGDQLAFDPRCVVATGGVIWYEPRQYAAVLAPWVREWLAEHEEWPDSLGHRVRRGVVRP